MNPSHRKLFLPKTDENRQNEHEHPCKEKPPNPPSTFPSPSSFPPPVNNGVHSHSLLSFTVAFGLLLGILLGLLHCCRRRNNFPRRRRINPISSLASQENHEVNHNQVQLDENPIWFINTAGLKESEINSIPAFGYKKHEGVTEGTECSVCLSEFREDERLKLLPKCNHAFHVACIDTWLRAHKNCPLCRAPIVVSSDAGVANDQSDRQNQVDGEGGGCGNLSSRVLSESSSTVVVLVPNAADEAETAEPKNPKPKNSSRSKTMRSFSSARLSSKGHLLDMKRSSSFAGI